MICPRCRKRQASVHVLDEREGGTTGTWLCDVCAQGDGGGRREPRDGDDDDAGRDDGSPPSSFLGDILAPEPSPRAGDEPGCRTCGTTRDDFRRTNRLGCADCYVTFRGSLLPVLARFHRHVSHVGRVPSGATGGGSRLGEITRTRVALEKAIGVEDFEAAARLRDRLRSLESGAPDPEAPR